MSKEDGVSREAIRTPHVTGTNIYVVHESNGLSTTRTGGLFTNEKSRFLKGAVFVLYPTYLLSNVSVVPSPLVFDIAFKSYTPFFSSKTIFDEPLSRPI